MAERVLIGDRTGRIVAEIEPMLGPVSWRLNNVGKATMLLARTDTKATEDNLQFGNRLLIQFDNGLPDWGGVIDPPRKWGRDGRIQVTAYSGEYLLGLRQTDRGRYFSSASVGYIFQSLIQEANAVWPTGVAIGQIWTGGDAHSPDYHYGNLLDKVQTSLVSRLSDADFVVTAAASGGYITFTAFLLERRGSDRPNVALIEDVNMSLELTEQGPIVNSWDIVGEGTTWGDDRPTAHADEAASIDAYGLREGSETHPDTSIQATLDATAENLLAESAYPRCILTPTASDLAPARFADYDVGDSVRVIAPSYGFGGYDQMVRVLTREYDPGSGACTLVVEES